MRERERDKIIITSVYIWLEELQVNHKHIVFICKNVYVYKEHFQYFLCFFTNEK